MHAHLIDDTLWLWLIGYFVKKKIVHFEVEIRPNTYYQPKS